MKTSRALKVGPCSVFSAGINPEAELLRNSFGGAPETDVPPGCWGLLCWGRYQEVRAGGEMKEWQARTLVSTQEEISPGRPSDPRERIWAGRPVPAQLVRALRSVLVGTVVTCNYYYHLLLSKMTRDNSPQETFFSVLIHQWL